MTLAEFVERADQVIVRQQELEMEIKRIWWEASHPLERDHDETGAETD